jgi:hypothetical protein
MEVLVVEQAGGCGVAMRRLLVERAAGGVVPRVVEVSSADDVLLHLKPQHAAFVVVVAHDLAAALCDVRQIAHKGGNVPLTLVVPGEIAAVWHGSPQWPVWLAAVRQAGAIDVAISLVELPRVAETIVRWQTYTPTEPISLRDTVWKQLPWSHYAG